LNSYICIYIIYNAFFMIECSFDVIDLFIFVIYDVQYVASTYGSKINWTFVFANHKWPTSILNALVVMFLGIHFKKMCGFVNLLFKLNIYVLSSRFKEFRCSENDISSFYFKYFNDWIYLFCLCLEVLLWKWIISIYLKRF
jgi:hypothetical protein